MGEYRAVKKGRHLYDVALVIRTPNGDDKYMFGRSFTSMKAAREVAEIFNREVGVIS